MDSISDLAKLCRLCLVNEDVDVPIFGDNGDIQQIFLKISACLPVKVSKEDNLPKSICMSCVRKLDMFYKFWNTSVSSEKQLLKWLEHLPTKSSDDGVLDSIPAETMVLKEEVIELSDNQNTCEDLADMNVPNEDPDYALEHQQLQYQPVEFQFQQDGFESMAAGEDRSVVTDTRLRPRKRRVTAVKTLSNVETEDEDDLDVINTKIAKTEEESDDNAADDPEPSTFAALQSADDEQPGPSGVGKSSSDTPLKKGGRSSVGYKVNVIKIEPNSHYGADVTKQKFSKLQTSLELEKFRVENYQTFGKRGRREKPIRTENIFIKEEIIEEELNLTFSTDEEEDVLEVVFNDNDIVAEEMHKSLSEKLNSEIVEGHCFLCNNGKKMFPDQLKKHYKKHERILMHYKEPKLENEEYSIFYCHSCKDGKVMTKEELRDHYLSRHETKISNDRKFFRKARCKRPRSPRPEVFRCEICSVSFPTKLMLEDHFDTHDDQYSCDVCSNGFKKLIDYTFHMQEHSEDKMFKCPLCEFSTDKGYLVKSHLYSVHDQFKKYKCELCGKGFAIFTHFQEHKYFHTGEKPFQCSECGQKFMYTRYLNSHKVQMHKKAQKGVECTICNKVYSHRNSLNTHMKSHTGALSVCDVCGKTLSSNEKLRLHYRIHTGEKPYKCVYCQKRFKTSSYKVEHERTHTGEKPYECPFCKKKFSQRTSMVIHSRGHTGEKPYFCHLCQKGFAAKSMVTIHLKSCKGVIGHVINNI